MSISKGLMNLIGIKNNGGGLPPTGMLADDHFRSFRNRDKTSLLSKKRDFIGVLFRHHARKRMSTLPRVNVDIVVLTPEGRPAVSIDFGFSNSR